MAYAIDVATKTLAVEKLSGGADIELLGTWLVLHLTRNPGAAFSTGTEFTLVLSVVAIAAVVVVALLRAPGRDTRLGLGARTPAGRGPAGTSPTGSCASQGRSEDTSWTS